MLLPALCTPYLPPDLSRYNCLLPLAPGISAHPHSIPRTRGATAGTCACPHCPGRHSAFIAASGKTPPCHTRLQPPQTPALQSAPHTSQPLLLSAWCRSRVPAPGSGGAGTALLLPGSACPCPGHRSQHSSPTAVCEDETRPIFGCISWLSASLPCCALATCSAAGAWIWGQHGHRGRGG